MTETKLILFYFLHFGVKKKWILFRTCSEIYGIEQFL